MAGIVEVVKTTKHWNQSQRVGNIKVRLIASHCFRRSFASIIKDTTAVLIGITGHSKRVSFVYQQTRRQRRERRFIHEILWRPQQDKAPMKVIKSGTNN
jgi:hypothetical protein